MMAARLLIPISVALCIFGANAREKMIPAGEEMAALQVDDPKDYTAVQRLLLGTVHRSKPKLSAVQEENFQTSKADVERQQVLSLTRQMMAERQEWGSDSDKYNTISKRLSEETRPEAPKPQKKRLSTLRIADENTAASQEAALSYKVNRILEKRRESKEAVSSWGAMKKESKSLRFGKTSTNTNSATSKDWSDLLHEFGNHNAKHAPQESLVAEQKAVGGPLSSFSWGEQESVAKYGPPKKLAMVAKKAVVPKVPDAMDMPEELGGFLHWDSTPTEWSSRSQKKGSNRYLTDLGN